MCGSHPTHILEQAHRCVYAPQSVVDRRGVQHRHLKPEQVIDLGDAHLSHPRRCGASRTALSCSCSLGNEDAVVILLEVLAWDYVSGYLVAEEAAGIDVLHTLRYYTWVWCLPVAFQLRNEVCTYDMNKNAYVLVTRNEYLIVFRYSCDAAYFQACIYRHAVLSIGIIILMCMRGDICKLRRDKKYKCLMRLLE